MTAVAAELDPLGCLPSLLALTRPPCDTLATPGASLGRDQLLADLRVDPILVLRALRLCQAPILGRGLKRASPRDVLDKLGPGALSRMVGVSAPSCEEPEILLQLWRHALATAVAARSLAELDPQPDVDPEEVHLCALLHDLPLWAHLTARSRGRRQVWSPLDWGRWWRLPDQVQAAWVAAHCGITSIGSHQETARLVVAGEAIAILAGYSHPSADSRLELELVRALAGTQVEQVLHRVRDGVQQQFEAAGLSVDRTESPPARDSERRPRDRLPPFAEGVVKLQELGDSERYRPVLTSLVAGACRYLGYDRSFYVQWIGRSGQALIRSKYDRTAVPVGGRLVQPSPGETALMGRVAGAGKPELLHRQADGRYLLLDHLASDGVLVVPVAGGSVTHGLLLLDCSYTCQHELTETDLNEALALSGVCGMTLSTLRLKRQDMRSRREAETDSLTGLLNRRAALNQLDREIQRCRRKQLPMSVLMLDLDHFKDMNDRYGHLTGDRILARVGEVLRATLRGSDLAARYGGEEFLVVQFDTTIEDSSIVAARIYKAVEEVGHEFDIPITISVGCTDLRDGDTVETVLRRADQALYASKNHGRNRFSVDS